MTEHQVTKGGLRAGAVPALLSALLFGVTTPIAKSFLQSANPLLIARLLYLGSGVGLIWLTLAIDVFSRCVVGFHLFNASHQDTVPGRRCARRDHRNHHTRRRPGDHLGDRVHHRPTH